MKLAAFVMKADHASKETVTCNLGGNPNHDIHIHPAMPLDEEDLCGDCRGRDHPAFQAGNVDS